MILTVSCFPNTDSMGAEISRIHCRDSSLENLDFIKLVNTTRIIRSLHHFLATAWIPSANPGYLGFMMSSIPYLMWLVSQRGR